MSKNEATSPSNKTEAVHLDYVNTPSTSTSAPEEYHHHGEPHHHDHHDHHDHHNYHHQLHDANDTTEKSTAVIVGPEHLGQLMYLSDPRHQQDVPYAEHGPLVDHDVPGADLAESEPELAWSKIRRACVPYFSEFFGTMMILL